MASISGRALAPYLILFAVLYAGFGVQSPYLPALLGEHGLAPEMIGIVLAGGTAIRLLAGPVAGRLADRLESARLVFAGCAMGAALAALGYLPSYGLWPLLSIALLQAAMLAPLAIPWYCRPPLRPIAPAGAVSITAGCAARDRAPSSSVRSCPARRSGSLGWPRRSG